MKFQTSNVKYDFDDILIEPAKVSYVESRKNIKLDYFPLIIAPMESVIDENNYNFFMDQDFSITYPRNKTFYASDLKNRKPLFFKSYGLEFDAYYHYYIDGLVNTPILIDVANGNMSSILDKIKELKTGYQYRNIKIMVGNVASPDTFLNLAKAGADYIRIGVGNGSACTTTVQTGIGYPMASLIKECSIMKYEEGLSTQIVADGGFRNYSEIIKALALGCFLPNMLVQTSNGSKPIQNIEIGDYVYTHTGKKQKVINKFIYDNTKEIIAINGIYSTDNHHYYVVHKNYKNIVNDDNVHSYAEWLPAKDLNNNYFLIENKINLLQQGLMLFKQFFYSLYINYIKIKKVLNAKEINK
jgi:IMP dehydrogenase/GMP reductase